MGPKKYTVTPVIIDRIKVSLAVSLVPRKTVIETIRNTNNENRILFLLIKEGKSFIKNVNLGLILIGDLVLI